MARTPSKRWMEMVEKVPQSQLAWSQDEGLTYPAEVVATLLSRQHASFVRMVKKLHDRVDRTTPDTNDEADEQLGYLNACRQILAALQQGGKK